GRMPRHGAEGHRSPLERRLGGRTDVREVGLAQSAVSIEPFMRVPYRREPAHSANLHVQFGVVTLKQNQQAVPEEHVVTLVVCENVEDVVRPVGRAPVDEVKPYERQNHAGAIFELELEYEIIEPIQA